MIVFKAGAFVKLLGLNRPEDGVRVLRLVPRAENPEVLSPSFGQMRIQ